MADEREPVKHKVVMNVVTRRPACVLLQAIYGGESSLVSALYRAHHWELNLSDNHQMVEGTLEEFQRHARVLDEQRENERRVESSS